MRDPPFFVPLPGASVWPWLLLTAIPHTTYKVFLARAYDTGELARVYPIMRGLTLALVTGASVGLLGESIPPLGLVGVGVIGVGVVALSGPGAGGTCGSPCDDPRLDPRRCGECSGLYRHRRHRGSGWREKSRHSRPGCSSSTASA